MPLLLFAVCVLTSSAVLSGETPIDGRHPLSWPTPPVVTGTVVGALPGSGSAGADGQYHYTLPLEVPPGRAGMQPSLSLSYSSGGGNGIMGVGWALGGVSTIHQCPKTHAVDGVSQPVDPGRLAAMCLDGARLINLSGDKYGPTDGAVYHTEDDSFSKIVFHGDLDNLSFVPYFEVWAKDGRILRYQTLDANHSLYPLRRVQDRAGNTVTYSYDYQGPTWVYPTKIEYTGRYDPNEDKPIPDVGFEPDFGKRWVTFNYEDREDAVIDRVVGIDHAIARRLKSIEMHAPVPPLLLNPADEPSTTTTTGLVWTYTLDYGAPSAGTAASLLRSVRRTGALGGGEYAKEFHWHSTGSLGPRGTSFTRTASPAIDISRVRSFQPVTIDVDGDGRDELVAELEPGEIRSFSTSGSSVLGSSRLLVQLSTFATLVDARFGDIDGDGAPEVIAPDREKNGDGFKYYRIYKWSPVLQDYVLQSGAPFETYIDGNDSYPQENPLFLVDLDGDGRPDLIKADHALDDPYLDQDRKDHNLPVGVVFKWSRRWNQGGVFGPKEVFFDPGPANDNVNVLAAPASGSPFAAFGISDGSAATRLLGVSTWVAFGVHNWHNDHPGAVDIQDPVAYPAASWQPVATGWTHKIDISGYTGVPGMLSPVGATTGNDDWFVKLQGDAFTSATSWLCGIGNFDGRTPAESYCVDPAADLPLNALPVPDADPEHWRVRTVDLDGDGRDDLIAYHFTPNGDNVPWFAFGVEQRAPDAAFRIWFDSARQKHVETLSVIPLAFGDFDGDGKVDVIGGSSSDLSAGLVQSYVGETIARDLMTEVWNESAPKASEIVTYAQEWAPPSASSVCAYPQYCLHRALNLVKSHAVYQGADVDAYRTRWFGYDDPRLDVRGRGFLGFARVREWDPERPSETITYYDNVSFDGVYYAFLPKRVVRYVPVQLVPSSGQGGTQSLGIRVTETETDYETYWTPGGKTFFRHPTSWRSSEWDTTAVLDWSLSVERHFGNFGTQTPLRERNGSYTFDVFGNVTNVHAETVGGSTSDVSLTYEYRTADWLVALVQSKTTAVAAPGGTPDPRHVFYAYDAQGNIESVHVELYDSDPRIPESIGYQRNADGLVTDVTRYADGETPRAMHTSYDPDEGIFPRTVWNDLGHTTQLLYHPAFGGLSDAIDANGVHHQAVYDDVGRVRQTLQDGGASVTRDYEPRLNGSQEVIGTLVKTYGQGLVSTVTGLDMLGRPVVTSHGGFYNNWVTARSDYDVLGRVVFQSRPAFGSPGTIGTTYLYDSLDRPLQTRLPDNNLALQWHSFWESHTVDPGGHESYVVRDVDGHVVESVQITTGYELVKTTYKYGDFHQLESIRDPMGNVTSMGYDHRGRRTSIVDPDTGLSTYDYNGFGEITDEWVPATSGGSGLARTTYERDVLGRVGKKTFSEGTTTSTTRFGWDSSLHGLGKLAGTYSPDGVEQSFTYDGYGRLAQEAWTIAGNQFEFAMGYDSAGRVSTIAYPEVPGRSRFTVQRSYSAQGYLQSVSEVGSSGGPLWQVLDRNADDSLLLGVMGNGLFAHRTYDDTTGRLAEVIDSPSLDPTIGVPVFSHEYTYTSEGLVHSRADHAAHRNELFDYDPLHRLTGWQLVDNDVLAQDVGYDYDNIGNLTHVSAAGTIVETDVYGCYGSCLPGTYKPHALAATIRGTGPLAIVSTFSHDARGRQVGGPVRQIDFSERDLPKTVTTASGTTTLRYDASGARVLKFGPGGSSTISLAGLYEQRRTVGTTQHVFYVPGTDGALAQVVYDPMVGTSVSYIHRDRLGSASAVSDETGQVTERMFYDPFGARMGTSATTGDVRVGFTGHMADQELGLVDMKGRIYDPETRHFLSADPHVTAPLNAQSYNRYSYVLNNPINLVDPTGFDWWSDSGYSYDATLWYSSSFDPYYGGTSSWAPSGGAPVYTAYGPPVEHKPPPPPPQKTAAQQVTPPYQAAPVPAMPSGPLGQAWLNPGAADFYRQVQLDLAERIAVNNAAWDANAGNRSLVEHYYDSGLSSPEEDAKWWEFGGGQGPAPVGYGYYGPRDWANAGHMRGVEQLGNAAAAASAIGGVQRGLAALRMAAAAAGEAASGGSLLFYSVQGEAGAARLLAGGAPWPQGVSKSLLGEGFYSWGSRAQAEAYMAHLEARGVTGLRIMEARIGQAEYNGLRSLDLRTMSDDAVNVWMETHSLYGSGVPHAFHHIIRTTGNFGPEFYFSKEVFPLFSF